MADGGLASGADETAGAHPKTAAPSAGAARQSAGRALPVLFVHIPKTAGTSFLTVLRNVFGDARTRRLTTDEELDPHQIDRLLESGLPDIDCLAGHFPVHIFADHLPALRPFTFLRHPVDRVMSLYRFLRAGSRRDQQRMGLPENFGFSDFLASRAPGLHGQIRNGMCRVLSGEPAFNNPANDAFWRPPDGARMVEQALAMLHRFDFGLVEDMPGSLAIAQRAWNTPFKLDEPVENATGAPGPEHTAENVLRVVEHNTLDLALYYSAARLFRQRLQGLASAASGSGVALAHAGAGTEMSVRDLPGRQGFHQYEKGGFAWLVANETPRMVFTADPMALRLKLKFYRITEDYPVDAIEITVNGAALPLRAATANDRWVQVETDPFTPVPGTNVLTLQPPYALPVRFLDPATRDRRSLSVALGSIAFMAES
jgi:hypothetical protein